MVDKTNRCARQERAKEGSSKEAWSPITREEIMTFIGVAVAMSISYKGDMVTSILGGNEPHWEIESSCMIIYNESNLEAKYLHESTF